jgi:HAD superfamily hydrolase (TIGR01509 family)
LASIKQVIFDFDGVLVDSELIANTVEVEIKTALGFPVTLDEQIEKFTGLCSDHPVLLAELERLPEDYLSRVDQKVKLAYERELKSIVGVTDLLARLKLPKCIASGSEPTWLQYKIELTGLGRFFDSQAIFSTHMVARGKPHPDVFIYAIEKLGWNAENKRETLVIEDSVVGTQAGRAAGLTVCGFLGGGHIRPGHKAKLRAAGADFCVANFASLVNYF